MTLKRWRWTAPENPGPTFCIVSRATAPRHVLQVEIVAGNTAVRAARHGHVPFHPLPIVVANAGRTKLHMEHRGSFRFATRTALNAPVASA